MGDIFRNSDRASGAVWIAVVVILSALTACDLSTDDPSSPGAESEGRSTEDRDYAEAAEAGWAVLRDESGEGLAKAVQEHEPTQDERARVALFYLMVAAAQETGELNRSLLDVGIFEEVQRLADRYPSVFGSGMVAGGDGIAAARAGLIRSREDFDCDKTCALDPLVFADGLLALAPIAAAGVLKADKAQEIWAQLSRVLTAATVRQVGLDEAAGMIDADTVNSILGLAASLVAGPEVLAAAAAGATASTVSVVAAVIGAASASFAAGRAIGQGIQLGIDCQTFKGDNCGGLCGNGIIESSIVTPESCDPATDCDGDLPAELCESSCPEQDADCDDGNACTHSHMEGNAFDCTAHCVDEFIDPCWDDDDCCPDGCYEGVDNDCPPACGNGKIETALGELCDNNELAGQSCTSRGFSAGQLRCAADCTSVDEAACTYCGNAVLDNGEFCDLNQLQDETCQSLGIGEGELRCNADCSAYDTAGCEGQSACSDQCSIGARSCDQGESRECVVGRNGCDEWGIATPCADGFCTDSESCGTCDNGCLFEGTITSCSGGTLLACEADTHGCLSWTHSMTCGEQTAGVIAIATGNHHTCALDRGRPASCWGNNSEGQSTVPGALGSLASIDGGHLHTCAVGSGGAVACWGLNDKGQSAVPSDLGPAVAVTTGTYHSCALDSAGKVSCWGDSAYGANVVPQAVLQARIVSINAGAYFTCAVDEEGTVRCWGDNFRGQTSPPSGLGIVAAVEGGSFHACALSQAGTVTCWGYNFYGQAAVPQGLGTVRAITAGYSHTCALDGDGHVTCWGVSDHGADVVPEGLSGVTAIDSGMHHTCAIHGGGAVSCWGSNSFGQLTVP